MSETPRDPNLRTFAVTYRRPDGSYRTEQVEAHNDSFEDDGFYVLWRYIETNYRVTSLRVRADRWESTVDVSRDMREERAALSAELAAHKRQSAELQDALHVARAQASEAQQRAGQLQARLEESQTPSVPDTDDIPF